MPSSDSEDFESADEGHSNVDKKERKARLSSSNYSDNALEPEGEAAKVPALVTKKEISKENTGETDGWDDFDIGDSEPSKQINQENISKMTSQVAGVGKETKSEEKVSGWNDWGDWEDDKTNAVSLTSKSEQGQPFSQDVKAKDVTDRLAAATSNAPSSGGWGWGWGVDSLLSTASAGITNLTSQVSQGITTVLETGIGAPDPEELARKTVKDNEGAPRTPTDNLEATEEVKSAGDSAFQFGNLLKFVGDTGSKVITGGLDTLETIGRKTMEVLQDGDPGLAKKRAMLGLDPDKPVLSQVLREAKAKAEEDDRLKEEKREAKEVHYENLFDDFEGLVHLEALEMLSKQVSMRIEEQLRAATADARQDMKETLQQVTELCEMPEEDEEEDDDEELEKLSKPDAFHERLQRATQDLGVKLQFQSLVKQYTDILAWLSTDDITVKALNKRAISSLAQATALSVEVYHKAAEMLLVKTRRSTADEADALTQMTVVLTKHTSDLATLFTEKLNSISTPDDAAQCNTYITNIFLEAGNSSTYIQNAFLLAQPIVQIGAV